MKTNFDIQLGFVDEPQVASLLQDHLLNMEVVSPPESRHALSLDGLRKADITFWTAWSGQELAGCAALKALSSSHGEVKSMKTSSKFLRKGVATYLLEYLIEEAKRRGYQRLSLETGSMNYFKPAQKLYARFGFKYCPPFGRYVEDPNSVFMTREL